MRGFTLIEMLVSVAIFTVVMTLSLSALLVMAESDRKAQTLKSVINNLNFSVESMSRAVRTGLNYHCDASVAPLDAPRDCTAQSATSLAFLAGDGSTVVYCLGAGGSCSAGGAAILRSVNGGTYAAITSPEVSITSLRFYVVGAPPGGSQPKVTILLSGSVEVDADTTSQFNLQTSVTERVYDQ